MIHFHLCDMTHSYVSPALIRLRDVTHLLHLHLREAVRHDSCIYMT